MRTTFVRTILTLSVGAALVCLAPHLSASAAQRGSRERTLFVSAVDNNGEPVADLGPDAFVVREDGVRREILRVSHATEPIDDS